MAKTGLIGYIDTGTVSPFNLFSFELLMLYTS